MTECTRYECCLCSYTEEGERGDRSLVDHLVRAHDLDRNAVMECECRPIHSESRYACFVGSLLVARVTIQGEMSDREEPMRGSRP